MSLKAHLAEERLAWDVYHQGNALIRKDTSDLVDGQVCSPVVLADFHSVVDELGRETELVEPVHPSLGQFLTTCEFNSPRTSRTS
jgi:hypothetical protein